MNMFLYQKPFVLSFLALFITCLCHCSATPFIVGDSSGWVIPPYPSYYSNWAHSHLMRVGDSLEFHFYHKLYNLVQVRQNNYDHCTTLEPVEIFNSSPAIIPLKEKGKLYLSDTINPTNKKQHQVHYSSNNKNPYTENTQQSRERTKGYNQEAVCQTIRKHTEDNIKSAFSYGINSAVNNNHQNRIQQPREIVKHIPKASNHLYESTSANVRDHHQAHFHQRSIIITTSKQSSGKGTVPPRSYKELKVSLPRAVHGRHWKRRTRHEIEREKMRGRVRHFPLSSHLRFLLSHRGESPTSSPTSMLDHRLRHCQKETRENSRLTSPSSSHFSFVFSLPPSSHFSPQNP
ncbi:hypothetical protein Lal_00008557 [Lupinus albus]|nr:hypothetical protein Lal_00008557 [Lupinus albus]